MNRISINWFFRIPLWILYSFIAFIMLDFSEFMGYLGFTALFIFVFFTSLMNVSYILIPNGNDIYKREVVRTHFYSILYLIVAVIILLIFTELNKVIVSLMFIVHLASIKPSISYCLSRYKYHPKFKNNPSKIKKVKIEKKVKAIKPVLSKEEKLNKEFRSIVFAKAVILAGTILFIVLLSIDPNNKLFESSTEEAPRMTALLNKLADTSISTYMNLLLIILILVKVGIIIYQIKFIKRESAIRINTKAEYQNNQ